MKLFSNHADIFLCRIVIQANVPHIKMVCELFDRCHGTLLQYVDFLCSAVTPTSAYAMLIPTLDELVHQYHLDPEVSLISLVRFSEASVVFFSCNLFGTFSCVCGEFLQFLAILKAYWVKANNGFSS